VNKVSYFAAPEDEATIKEMKRLYDKVEEMKTQRQRLEQQLREELLKDDVTAALVTQGDKNQEVLC
jgi:ALIX V-shaped domain binding to HIV